MISAKTIQVWREFNEIQHDLPKLSLCRMTVVVVGLGQTLCNKYATSSMLRIIKHMV